MRRICFLIRSLERGGAERQLVELVKHLDRTRFVSSVLTFYRNGPLARELERAGVDVVPLDKKDRWDLVGFGRRAYSAVKSRRPDLVHGYLGVANELAWALGKASGAPVIWGIRSSAVDFNRYDWSHRVSFGTGALLSRDIDLIIYNSESGAVHHRARGYRPRKEAIVPNGIDTRRFAFSLEGRERIRRNWGVQAHQRLVGLVGRLDPMKGHTVFLDAAARLLAEDSAWRFVCVGEPRGDYETQLRRSDAAHRLGRAIIWAGPQDDMPAVYSALDCLVLPSLFGEGFPNVVAEAMACERVCVVSDVGDASTLVTGTGQVVPVGDPARLARACTSLFDENDASRRRRGVAGRQRIVSTFTVERLAERTACLLEEVAASRRSRQPALE